MATVIKIKNSGSSGSPSALGTGELAYSYLSGTQANGGDRVYVGTGVETGGVAANIEVVGGKYFTSKLDHPLGVRTASSAALLDASGKIDVWDVDNLRLDGNTIVSTNTNGNISITPAGTGDLILDGQKFPQADGSASQYLQTDGSGQLSWSTVVSTITIGADSGTDDVVNTGESISFVGGNLIDTTVSANTLTFDINDSELYAKFSSSDTSGHGSFSYNNSTGAFSHTRVTVADVRGDVSATDDASGHGSFAYNSATGVFAHSRVTSADVRSDISVVDSGGDGSLSYTQATGVITYTGPTAAEVRAHVSAGTGVAISNGQISIGQPVGTSDNVTFGNATVGNLTVNGTTTTVNSAVVTIDDPIFTLGTSASSGTDDNKDRGIEFRYNDGAARVGFMGWDDSNSGFTLLKNATNTSEVFSGTVADLAVGTVTGTEFIGLIDGGTY
jgi:hypothetical protein